MARLLAVFWIPAVLIGVAVAVAAGAIAGPPGMVGLLPVAPYVVAALAAALAMRFHQSRAVFAAWVLVLAWAAMSTDALAGGAALVLAPVNLAAVAFLSERGVLTRAGVWRLGAITAQAVAVAWAVFAGDANTVADLGRLVDYRFAAVDRVGGLTQPALAAAVLAFVVLLARAARTGAPLDGGLAAAVAALALAGYGFDGALLTGVAALALTVAVVQESYRLAYVDELTGLPGRRALMTAMGKLGGRYTVAMVDVDHFKKFNDTYGHDVGDQVLQMVATRVGRVSGGGKGFRYGGEEFTVLFPGRDAEGAREHLEALRAAVESAGFKLRGKDRPKAKPATRKAAAAKTVSVTVSIGGADASDGTNPADVLKAADKRLYKAKKAGRNRVAV